MRNMFSRVVVTASLSALLLLTSVPPTSRLVPEQLNILIGRLPWGLDGSQNDTTSAISKREAEVSAAHPDDFDLQLAEAIRVGTQREPAASEKPTILLPGPDGIRDALVRSLVALQPRFGDHAELEARLLSCMASDDLVLDRPEEDTVEASSSRQYTVQNRTQTMQWRGSGFTQQALAAAGIAGARGEILDPQNAYFPAMLAYIFLVQHRDSDALAELFRAAQLPDWNDYSAVETLASSDLYTLANGGDNGFSHLANTNATRFAEMHQIRSMARVMTAFAVKRELAGDREGGFRLRMAIARLGAAMRARSKSFVGCLTGMNVTSTTSARPGGAKLVDMDNTMSPAAGTAAADARYIAYLSQIGHPEAATWYVAERAAGERMHSVFVAAQDATASGLLQAFYLNVWWMVDVYLLETTAAIAICGFLAMVAARSRRINAGLGVHRGIRFGVALILQVPLAWYIASLYENGLGYESPAVKAAIVETLIVVLLFFLLKRGRTCREAALNGLVAAGTLLAFCLTVGTVWCLGAGLSTTAGLCTALGQGGMQGSGSAEVNILFGSLTLLLPAITGIVYAIRGRRTRLPASVALVRGMRDCTPAAVACLLAAYTLACVGTCLQDGALRRDTDQRLADEGKYSTTVTSMEWPGPVPYPIAPEGTASAN